MARAKRWNTILDESGSGCTEVNLSSWKYFSDYINQEMLNYSAYIYRGHGDKKWLLEPTIDRHIKEPTSRKRQELLDYFILATRGRRGSNPAIIKDDNDWWALGQHHGLMTPLLDWSESPFVALYFAVTVAIKEKTKYLTVICFSQTSIKEINKKLEKDSKVELINSLKPTVKLVRPLSNENTRLVSQRGLFTRGPNNMDLESWVKKFMPKSNHMDLIKINIPNKELLDCLKYLNRMNVNSSTLFPDLTGAANYCNLLLEIDGY
ncbi:MAG: FRG domain-containing protein [Sulfurimonas sp.]|jgi:hypothetical protein